MNALGDRRVLPRSVTMRRCRYPALLALQLAVAPLVVLAALVSGGRGAAHWLCAIDRPPSGPARARLALRPHAMHAGGSGGQGGDAIAGGGGGVAADWAYPWCDYCDSTESREHIVLRPNGVYFFSAPCWHRK